MLIQLLYDTRNKVLVRYSGQKTFDTSVYSNGECLKEMHPDLVEVATISGRDISFKLSSTTPVKIFSYNAWRSEIAFQKKTKKGKK